MVGREDFKKKAKEMAEKARAKAQGEKARQAPRSEADELRGRVSEETREASEKLRQERDEGPENW